MLARPDTSMQRNSLIPDEFIDEVNQRIDILELIQQRVSLKKTGNNWVGLCPFHSEKSPSFSVNPDKGMYHCFGCGASGSALKFVVEHDGTPFRQAVKELAHEAGLQLPATLQDTDESGMRTSGIDTAILQPLYACLTIAANFYQFALKHHPPALAYLKSRGINAQTITKYMLGVAPDEWHPLSEAFDDYTSNETLQLCGLTKKKNTVFDVFRSRVMFPIRDSRGRVQAFGARIFGTDTKDERDAPQGPKYLNSPETAVFHKSESMFGLFEARESIRKKKMVVVVEGYIDVVMLSQSGIPNAVACMGTSITSTHIERLLTQSTSIAFAFDGDKAGRAAAWRALINCLPLLQDQYDIRFLILPAGKDPDDLAREEGVLAFETRIQKAPSLTEFLILELHLKHNQLKSTENRARFAEEATKIVNTIPYQSRIRKLLLQRIQAESSTPGSVLRALQVHSSSRAASNANSLWTKLSKAASIAINHAIEERDLICSILDLEDPHEAALNNHLQELRAQDAAPERLNDPSWLIARDTLRAGVDMIAEYRNRQIERERFL